MSQKKSPKKVQSQKPPKKHKRRRRFAGDVSREQVLADVTRVARVKNTDRLTRDEYNEVGKYAESTWKPLLGTWRDVIHYAGLRFSSTAKKNRKPIEYKHFVVPNSEDSAKQNYTVTADDCIEDLRRLSLIHEDKFITRNFYRKEGTYSDSTWNRFFGTFAEFARKAGLKLSRQQHRMEQNVAKHASIDQYRKLNIDRLDYADKYERGNNNRFKTVLAITDIHDSDVDWFLWEVFIDTIKRVDPDVIILGGDLFDLAEFSSYTKDPRTWDITSRIKFVHSEILGRMRDVAPDTQIDLIEGNHEFRLLKHLGDSTPAMKAILSDLHGFTVASLLGLDDFEVNYIAKGDLATYSLRDQRKEVSKNYKIYWNSLLAHHFPAGRNLGFPGFCGHHHKLQVWPQYNATHGSYSFYQMGGACLRDADYTTGEIWNSGFMLAHVDTMQQSTVFEYIDVQNFCCVGGKFYHRNDFARPDDLKEI